MSLLLRSRRVVGKPGRHDEAIAVLRGVCHALASAPDLDELGPSLVRWVGAALGEDPAEVRVMVSGPKGRLHTLIAVGDGARRRGRSKLERAAFDRKEPVTVSLRRPTGHGRLAIPMVSRGETYGVVEVVAPVRSLESAGQTLEAVASQGAIALRGIWERSVLNRRAEAFAALGTLGRKLMAAPTAPAAVQVATEFCHAHLHVPVAGWLARPGSCRLDLVAVRGLGSRRRTDLHRGPWTLPASGVDDPDIRSLVRRFGEVVESAHIEVVRTRDAVVVAGALSERSREEVRTLLDAVASLLDEALGLLAVVRRAEIRNERLDLGIAWTAHELRGPLLSLRGFLDLQAQRGGELREEYFQAHRELDELVQELEGLLRWATGARELHRRPTDLVRLVREAVGVCTEGSSLEVSVSGPTSAPVVAEPGELRRAIANVVRNAIAYSPRDEAIDVSIERRDGSFVVSVRDRGPGVSAEEADSIFDPFVRGLAARGHRGGRGLGLFIARKVIEAHRGTIWVEPARRGATFRIQVPT